MNSCLAECRARLLNEYTEDILDEQRGNSLHKYFLLSKLIREGIIAFFRYAARGQILIIDKTLCYNACKSEI